MALAGVAAGADPIIDASFDGTLPTGFTCADTTNGASYIDSGLEGYGQAIDFNKSNYISISSGFTDIVTGANGSDFSIVTTVRFDSWEEAFPSDSSLEKRLFICGSGGTNGNGIGWTVAEGVMGITRKSVWHDILPADQTITLSLDTWYTLGLTYDAATGTATFYVDGESAGTLDLGEQNVNTPSGGFGIGTGRSDGNLQASWDGAMADFKLYDTVLSANEIAAFGAPTPAVPEPTTATLSLLALAGLAARRRRK